MKFVVELATLRDKSEKIILVHVLYVMGVDEWRRVILSGVVWNLVVTVMEQELAGIHD